MKYEKLTKENFWDELYERYSAVQVFCDWIDEYKKRVNWNVLFNGGIREYPYVNGVIKFTDVPKFHDLPIAMQWGIFQQFCAENHPSGFGGIESTFEHPIDVDKIPELITEYFAQTKSSNDQLDFDYPNSELINFPDDEPY
jgi:hypothetical protein